MNNKSYTCLIVDDEPPAREVLRRYVQQMPMLSIAGECPNSLQAMALLKQRPVDLLFLDIQMPQITGIDLIKTMPSLPKIILTTAFEQYALQAFDLDVTDYLLKPISFERFLKAVMKALPTEEHPAPHPSSAHYPSPSPEPSPFLYFRSDRKMVKVLLDEILYVESLKDYIKIRTSQGTVISKHSMAALEAMLPETRFIRIHRSFIAAVDKIRSFTPELLDIGDTQLPIGKLYRHQVLRSLQGT
ncbi:MAG: response regulator transcription factor [Bacteroidetes bacterium]|nr:response regulator transcription factor [Bacteroidota bacterium]